MSKKGLPEGAYGLENGQTYIPYVPSNKVMPEFTALSVVVGIILAVVFGAANAYLGLRVGMTVSASIPAAVISMAIVRVILRRKSILENNMVQTIASAGESLAAGAIFTLPALFMMGEQPSAITMAIITMVGGALGVFFMIPIRRYLIVQEHGKLPYPEGTACAEVLVAGEEGGANAGLVFAGGAVGLLYKLLADGFKLFQAAELEWQVKGFEGSAVGLEAYPALVGVGFIIGPKISAYMLAGAVLGWFCILPLIAFIGIHAPDVIYPAGATISEMLKSAGPGALWSKYLRYIGAGAVATGGIISLIKSIPVIVSSFRDAMKGFGAKASGAELRTDKDISFKWIALGTIFFVLVIWLLPAIPVNLVGAILVVIFGFFFVTVSSRIVGLVGSSSNPVSGMTIATLIFTAVILKATGMSGNEGMIATISIGAVICTAAAIAGDTSQDLKTGYLIGATPWKQQIGELVGVLASALVIGFILIMLNNAYTFGSDKLGAPQATLMKMVTEGIMNGDLPWNLIYMGAAIAVVIELFGIPALPVAIGLYLPIGLSTPIMVGGIVRGILDRKEKNEEALKDKVETGILYSSGLIAGEGLMGVILAGLTAAKVKITNLESAVLGKNFSLLFFAIMVISLIYFVFWRKSKVKA